MAKVNLSELNDVLEKQNGAVFHVGIDVHKNSYHVAFWGDAGQSTLLNSTSLFFKEKCNMHKNRKR